MVRMNNLRVPWSLTTSLTRRVLAATALPAGVTLLAIPEQHPSPAVVAVLYVLAVVVTARVAGALSGIVASLLSFLSLNFFFTPPFHTFAVAAPEDLVALFVFLVASVIVGVLLSAALNAKSRAERRELEATMLNRLATGLLAEEATENVLTTFAEGLCDGFDLSRCEISTTFTPTVDSRRAEDAEPAERVRLSARGQDIGEIRVWVGTRSRLGDAEQTDIESLATQLALALEGMRLRVEMRRVELEAHTSRLKAALFSGVTHDVKTPLAAIMAAVTSLIDGPGFSEAERREHLDTIRQEAERLHRVVNNLLDVARLRAGALVATKVPSAIEEVMESTLNRLRPLLGDRAVEMKVGDEVPEVFIDVVQIDQVLTNLIENAIKFTPQGSPVSLVAVGSAEVVRVTVSDRGPGIPKDDRDRIFEPFERGGVPASGTGLGLAISNAIVIAHGGRMWVSDNPMGGAAFTFELPCGIEPSSEEVSDVAASAGG
jgi:two-component system, OmpR family, sensor histidine kinase KdpD